MYEDTTIVTVFTTPGAYHYYVGATYKYDPQERKYVVYTEDGFIDFPREQVVLIGIKNVTAEEIEASIQGTAGHDES